jgi:hypothetical protein
LEELPAQKQAWTQAWAAATLLDKDLAAFASDTSVPPPPYDSPLEFPLQEDMPMLTKTCSDLEQGLVRLDAQTERIKAVIQLVEAGLSRLASTHDKEALRHRPLDPASQAKLEVCFWIAPFFGMPGPTAALTLFFLARRCCCSRICCIKRLRSSTTSRQWPKAYP